MRGQIVLVLALVPMCALSLRCHVCTNRRKRPNTCTDDKRTTAEVDTTEQEPGRSNYKCRAVAYGDQIVDQGLVTSHLCGEEATRVMSLKAHKLFNGGGQITVFCCDTDNCNSMRTATQERRRREEEAKAALEAHLQATNTQSNQKLQLAPSTGGINAHTPEDDKENAALEEGPKLLENPDDALPSTQRSRAGGRGFIRGLAVAVSLALAAATHI